MEFEEGEPEELFSTTCTCTVLVDLAFTAGGALDIHGG